jgi:methylenetetrahydrofolate dehydrogenase (NADP+)/methenyltetrahydrofolate cyclohydrolase
MDTLLTRRAEMAKVLEGKAVVAAMKERQILGAAKLLEKGITPALAIIRVGERPDDISYEKGATKRAQGTGVAVKTLRLPADATQGELLELIDQVNKDASIHGVLLLRPLPKTMDDEIIRTALDPAKDVDGITDGSLAGVFAGTEKGYAPCTAQACIEILDHYGVELAGKKAAVIGRSIVAGKPVSMLLLGRNATVTICHTKTADMPEACRQAEILIVAAGRAGIIGKEHLSPGQTVIDVGINFKGGKLVGDVDFEAAEQIAGAITPVPGGVGTVTTSVLVGHVIKAALRTAEN